MRRKKKRHCIFVVGRGKARLLLAAGEEKD